MAKSYWLVKSEPFKYGWDEFVKDGSTYWDGVRNAQARNNLQAMKKGDAVLYYHSNEGKEVVGVAKVTKTAYQDPTTDDERWVVVDLEPVQPLAEPVSLATIKADAKLRDIPLVTRSRLSVIPLERKAFEGLLFGCKLFLDRIGHLVQFRQMLFRKVNAVFLRLKFGFHVLDDLLDFLQPLLDYFFRFLERPRFLFLTA